jgi:hypothetical protein
MANQDILYQMWIRAGYPTTSVKIGTISSFARSNQKILNSRTNRGISSSGLDYAVLKFILDYTLPVNWSQGLWEQFIFAKDPRDGNYGIWRRYTNLLVDINPSSECYSNPRALENDWKPRRNGYPGNFIRTYSIFVTSQPDEANIIISNIYRGKTPTVIQALLEGDHTIECTREGFLTKTKKVRVSCDVSINFKLEKIQTSGTTVEQNKPIYEITKESPNISESELRSKKWLFRLFSNFRRKFF